MASDDSGSGSGSTAASSTGSSSTTTSSTTSTSGAPQGSDGSSTPTSFPSGQSPIDGLTTNIQNIKETAAPDVKLSTETRDQYLKIIQDYTDALKAQSGRLTYMAAIGNAGGLLSANETKANLTAANTGVGGAMDTLDKFLVYLGDFSDTVKSAADALIHKG